jgi:hypothetical protein
MFLVVIAALLLANLIQMMALERQRRIAEQAHLEATVARQRAEVSLMKLQVVVDQQQAQKSKEFMANKPSRNPKLRGEHRDSLLRIGKDEIPRRWMIVNRTSSQREGSRLGPIRLSGRLFLARGLHAPSPKGKRTKPNTVRLSASHSLL